MRRIILVASLLVVIELAGSSILNRVEQHRVNTIKQCVEVESAFYYQLDESTNDIWLKCYHPEEYLDYDLITDHLTCKQNAPEKCKASVQELGRVWHKVWPSVRDPTICKEYEFVDTLVTSCN